MKTLKRIRSSAGGAFTIIEMIGVIAVMAILAVAIAPLLVTQLDNAARLSEDNALGMLAKAIQTQAYRQHYLPGATTFGSTIANEVGWPIENVTTNVRYNPRIFLVDGAMSVGPSGATTNLPYQQGMSASQFPTSPRVMILSSLGVPLPTNIVSGVMAAATFSNLWATLPNTVPSGWTWNGNAQDLRIQRVNFLPWFVQLVLNNSGTANGEYSIDGMGTNTLPTNPFSVWVIKGTKLGLIGTNNAVQAYEILNDSESFTFVGGSWSAATAVVAGQTNSTATASATASPLVINGTAVEQAAEYMVSCGERPGAGCRTIDVCNAWKSFLTNHLNWCSQGCPSSGGSAWQNCNNNRQTCENQLFY